MSQLKKISCTLSIAASVLLEACSSGGSDASLSLTANTVAPELIGSWQSRCTITPTSAGRSETYAMASGGGGSGGSPKGAAYIELAIFEQSGLVKLITENFATTNCNANTSTGRDYFEAAYITGGATFANDGSPATQINYNTTSSSTFSIFQIVDNVDLYLGNIQSSTAGHDGSSEANRLDGLGVKLSKI